MDEENLTTQLIAKSRQEVGRGQTVILQVKNPDGRPYDSSSGGLIKAALLRLIRVFTCDNRRTWKTFTASAQACGLLCLIVPAFFISRIQSSSAQRLRCCQ